MPCCCRNIAETSDEPCRLDDKAPYFSWLSFGSVVDYKEVGNLNLLSVSNFISVLGDKVGVGLGF